jgi:excisionase family DNA binding protein
VLVRTTFEGIEEVIVPDAQADLAAALTAIVQRAVEDALAATPTKSGDGGLAVDTPDAARRLGLGETTVKRLISSGELESVTVGARRVVPVAALGEFLKRRRRAT